MKLRERLLNDNDFIKVDSFECGVENDPLTNFLKDDAFKDNKMNLTKTYLIEDKASSKIIGYYSLRTNGVGYIDKKQHNKIFAIPVIEMSEFAIDFAYQGKGIGTNVFNYFVISHAKEILSIVGCQAILVYAFHPNAIHFYKKLGFYELEIKDDLITIQDDFASGCKTFLLPLIK